MIVSPILDKYFVYDRVFNLFHYQDTMEVLYNDLLPMKKCEYQSNYRFIFLHYDTDYYITNNQPGILLRNLQKILVSLDIPNYFCLILTEQNIQKELDQLAREETSDDCSISSIQHGLQDWIHKKIPDSDLNRMQISKKYICLNRFRRSHRALLFSILKNKNLLDDGIVSFGHRSPDVS